MWIVLACIYHCGQCVCSKNAQRNYLPHATRELVLHTNANQCLAVYASCLYHRSVWRYDAADIFDVVGVLSSIHLSVDMSMLLSDVIH